MTKKDFAAIAHIIGQVSCKNTGIRYKLTDELGRYFAHRNENFDRDKFTKAVAQAARNELDAIKGLTISC